MDVVAASAAGEQSGEGPLTLAIDIGGSRLKAGILDAAGRLAGEPVRVNTPHNDPEAAVSALVNMVKPLGAFDRISIGFPGVVKRGVVLTAPNLGTEAWHDFPLAKRLSKELGKPVRLLNDASVQGLGVIAGEGLECVITLGTGFGFALFHSGRLAPHLELGQHPVRKDMTYDQYLGSAALADVGKKKWNKRLKRALGFLTTLLDYDTLYVGGGNAKHIVIDLPGNVHIVPNAAGITGGVRLWDSRMDETYF